MNRLAHRSAAVVAGLVAALATPTWSGHAGARVTTDEDAEASAAECEIGGMTPGLARRGRPSHLQIAWNPVDVAELVAESENLLEVRLEGAGGILRGERAYVLTGVELRARSESKRYPAEARFIHHNAGGDRIVVGVYLTEGAANPAFETLRAAVDSKDSRVLSGLDPRALLPHGDARLVFADRTPASCAPRVVWTVVDAPVEASQEQLAALLTAPASSRSGEGGAD